MNSVYCIAQGGLGTMIVADSFLSDMKIEATSPVRDDRDLAASVLPDPVTLHVFSIGDRTADGETAGRAPQGLGRSVPSVESAA